MAKPRIGSGRMAWPRRPPAPAGLKLCDATGVIVKSEPESEAAAGRGNNRSSRPLGVTRRLKSAYLDAILQAEERRYEGGSETKPLNAGRHNRTAAVCAGDALHSARH